MVYDAHIARPNYAANPGLTGFTLAGFVIASGAKQSIFSHATASAKPTARITIHNE
jgi:hypothetical protein